MLKLSHCPVKKQNMLKLSHCPVKKQNMLKLSRCPVKRQNMLSSIKRPTNSVNKTIHMAQLFMDFFVLPKQEFSCQESVLKHVHDVHMICWNFEIGHLQKYIFEVKKSPYYVREN